MAFLCPVRIKRSKKKKQDEESIRGPTMGRITGSASIETLVRVGIEKEAGLSPESKMVVLHDFSPCVDDELEVKRGQIVHVLYQENDWVYVISDANREGFIPHSYTAQFGSQLADLALKVKKKMNRDPGVEDQGGGQGQGQGPGQHNSVNTGLDFSDSDSLQDMRKEVGHPGIQNQSRTSSLLSESSSQPEVHPFYKDSYGKYIVLYKYSAQDENDLSVERGQCVSVLNKDDPEWFWVQKSDGEEGFVPAGFIYPLDALQKQQTMSGGLFQTSQPLPPVPTSLGNGHAGGRATFLATPTLASPVAQQFSQLSISPQQISSGPMSNMSSLSAPLSSISGHVSLPGSLQTSLPGATNQQHGLPSSGHQSLPGQHGHSGILNGNHASTSPDIISSTTGGFGNNQKSSSLHNMSASSHQMSVSSHQMSSAHSVAMSSLGDQQQNSLTSTVSGIRSSGSVTTGSTANSGPNSLSPGTANGLPPPPSSQGGGGGGGGGSGRSSQLGGGGSQSGGETRYGGTELVMLYDYKAQAPDDLSVRRGDWIYADLQNQTVDGWLWAYAPKTRKYGFIPKAYARPPAMTNL